MINKEAFLDELFNSSSYEDVISKIEKEKEKIEKIKDSGPYILITQLHLSVIEEIEFYMKNGVSKIGRNGNERIAGIFNKFSIKK